MESAKALNFVHKDKDIVEANGWRGSSLTGTFLDMKTILIIYAEEQSSEAGRMATWKFVHADLQL